METDGKVGTVKMKPLYALKRACEGYSMEKVRGGGILRRFQSIADRAINEKIEEKQRNTETKSYEKDNAMFGIEVLEELGLTQEQVNSQKRQEPKVDIEERYETLEETEEEILR